QSALASLAGVLADPDGRKALETASSPQEVLAALDAQGDPPPSPASEAPVTGSETLPPADAFGTSQPADSTGGPAPADSTGGPAPAGSTGAAPVAADMTTAASADTVPSRQLILTVCGNGLGTSLFLKNTAEQVLDRWGWSSYLNVEATDTISAKGRAKDADVILTSGAIAQT